MLLPLVAKPYSFTLLGLPPKPSNLSRNRRNVVIYSVMGGYQYQSRAEKLRSRGVDVYHFGNRVLREGCFGEDVLELQNWLAEETYYHPVDGGYTGYFGSVTKEALQSWQRDNGLSPSGQFDSASKWAYLRSVEARVSASSPFIQNSFHATSTFVEPNSNYSSATPFFAGAAVLAGIALARLLAPTLKKKTSAALSLFFSSALFFNKKSHMTEMEGPDGLGSEKTLSPYSSLLQDNDTTRYTESDQDQNADGVIDEQQSIRNDTQQTSRLRRLSEEEIQRYIAPFKKGEMPTSRPSRPPTPLKSTPSRRPLVLDAAGQVGAVSSRHGTYYGGRKVLDKVKEYLTEEGSLPSPIGAAHQRMKALGYDMQKNKSKKNEGFAMDRTRTAPATSPLEAVRQNSLPGKSSSFEDVMVPTTTANGSYSINKSVKGGVQALLSGTELERMPESPLRPVPVQRSSSSSSSSRLSSSVLMATEQDARPKASRPVPVVKSGMHENIKSVAPVEKKNPPVDPYATVVLDKPVKLHKPARLIGASTKSFDDEE